MEINLKEISCYNCGVSFWITDKHNHDLLRLKTSFFCPNGHPQSYTGDTEEQRLQKIVNQKNNIIFDLEQKLKKKCKKKKA